MPHTTATRSGHSRMTLDTDMSNQTTTHAVKPTAAPLTAHRQVNPESHNAPTQVSLRDSGTLDSTRGTDTRISISGHESHLQATHTHPRDTTEHTNQLIPTINTSPALAARSNPDDTITTHTAAPQTAVAPSLSNIRPTHWTSIHDLQSESVIALLRALQWDGQAEEVLKTASDMFRDHDLNFTIEDAQQWGQDFWSLQPPNTLIEAARTDSAALSVSGDISTLARTRQDAVSSRRLSLQTIENVTTPVFALHDSSGIDMGRFRADVELLRIFATSGVPIITAPGFRPSHDTGPMASNYKLAPEAVDAHILKAWRAGLGILLTPEAASTIPNRHEMRSSIAPKKGKAAGRLTLDNSTNSSLTPPYMNTDEAKELCRQYFGDFNDIPDIASLCSMIIELADRYGPDNVVLWKTDLRAAFTLLKFAHTYIHWLSTRLLCGLIYFVIQGNFGWTGMPFAFQVVVRVLIVCISLRIQGKVQMYVDDLIGASHRAHWTSDRHSAITIMNDLLGPDAEEPDKRESTEDSPDGRRAITILGWEFVLSTWTVDIARRNRLKALFTFWAFDIDKPVSLDRMEAMCSMAHRYAKVYREMGVFMPDLYSALPRWRQRHHIHTLPDRTKTAIKLWRAYLVRAEICFRTGHPAGRDIYSFRHHTPTTIVEFDGSPKGIGFRLFRIIENIEVLVEEWGALLQYDLRNDPQYQNTMELTAATCGLFRALQLWRPPGLTIQFRGDSEVALTWLTDDQVSAPSSRARGPAMILATVRARPDTHFASKHTHLPKEFNTRADALSRGFDIAPINPTVPLHNNSTDPLIHTLLGLANPLTQPSTETEYIHRWECIATLCEDHFTLSRGV